jgi:L-amino acid N-acyltransferase YncA
MGARHVEGRIVRVARASDGRDIQAIYAPIVRDTPISFEVEPPSITETEDRIRSTLGMFPYLVCEADGRVVGYAYAGSHRERAAYRWSVDVTVYVGAAARRTGVGHSLYRSLLSILRRQRFHSAFAGITLPNESSVALHEAVGFRHLGVYEQVGFKLGGWHDVGWWRCGLGLAPPAGEPIPFAALAGEVDIPIRYQGTEAGHDDTNESGR